MRCPTCHRRVAERCPLHPSAEPRSAVAPARAPDVPGFAVVDPLGRGGFGRVFSARREADGREVALKVLEPLASERLEREVEALRRVGPPAAPRLLGETRAVTGEPVVVMERIDGLTLARRLAELPGPGALPWSEAAPLMRCLAEAVGHVHAAAVVHRDLKPENVMLAGARLVLLDFGLARLGAVDDAEAPAPTLTRTGQRLGTHEYMAPEQCRDARALDARADLYSLGVVFFELLCGRPPFVGDTAAVLQGHVSRRPPSLRELAPGPVPARVEALVQRLLAKDPEERFPSAAALLDALVEVPDTEVASPVVAARAGPPGAETRGPREVALLGVKTSMEVPAMLARLSASGAELARVEAGLAIFAFPQASGVEAGLRAALRAAEVLGPVLPSGSVRVIHCAPLRVRERGGRLTVGGAALERPEKWWPAPESAEALAPTQDGLRSPGPGDVPLQADDVTKAPASAESRARSASPAPVPASTAPPRSPASGSSVSPAGASASVESPALTPEARAYLGETPTGRTPAPEVVLPTIDALLGREAELSWLREGLARARDSGAPTLRTLLGQEGHGKTRLLTTWHRELRSTPGVSALFVEALPDEGSASESGLRNLITTLFSLPPSTPPDEAVRKLLVSVGDAPTVHPAARRQLIARELAFRLWRLAADRPLVLLVDDAHTLDPTALDALELATLAGVSAPLCVVLAGRHRLLGLRPYLGERARDSALHELPPLDEGAARELLRQLLRPVDLIAEGVVRELVDRCGGSPLRLLETARVLRAAGAIRARADGGAYLAADALHALASDGSRPDELLAERRLAALPSGLRSVLQVAALLGDEVRLEELSATLAHLDGSDALDLSLDPGVALERLARAGTLEPRGPRRWRFEHATLREAFAALLPPARKRHICAAALKALPHAASVRRARLAEGAGDIAQAHALHRMLAESARRAHRLLEAERHYSAALELLPRGDDTVRLDLLSGRGRVRYRLQRIDDALADLRAARALAESHGDAVREADLLLEEATALDWQDDSEGSTALLEQALGRLGDTVPPELAARHALARARVVVRGGDIPGAVPPLERALELARAGGDAESEAIALSMLGAMLAWTGRLDEAARRFDEAISLCEATGDTLHLGVALNNRMVLRVQHRDVAGARADLERAVSLGRELGNVQIERTSAFNLALLLGYQGRAAEALPLARRAGVLSQRFFPGSMAQDALLVARLCCELGDMAEAARQLTWLEEPSTQARLPPGDQLMLSVVRRVVGEARGSLPYDPKDWAGLVETARQQATPDERLEVLVWAARAARVAGDTATVRARAREVDETAHEAPLWTERVRALEAEGP
ncbi:protein kinase [Pyxidicoccus fallax]|uniref:Protein kinase n=1 Tax=Pyxidicoccus fallax TaxID=394095 RepID=A0A848L7C4_9BACT|nr:serine/threonine-protein kinase [Pyxidicoccus fallax]NMO14427.1 protein kinase [Pyxidicoccus fallax]NPC77594.1 protein kinase [Pyxidicoccus fallax]